MIKALTHDTSNKRFLAYVALFYVLAMTAGAWVPASAQPLLEPITSSSCLSHWLMRFFSKEHAPAGRITTPRLLPQPFVSTSDLSLIHI